MLCVLYPCACAPPPLLLLLDLPRLLTSSTSSSLMTWALLYPQGADPEMLQMVFNM
jgi:hypothetical protein